MNDPHIDRLRLLMALFKLTQSDICSATGYSRPFLSRLLKCQIRASPAFYARLNSRLLDLLKETGTWCCVFDVGSSTSEKVDNALGREQAKTSCLPVE